MIEFLPLDPAKKSEYDAMLQCSGERGCEYSFTNLYLWGRQKAAIVEGCLVFFSQFNRKSVYLFPVGCGDRKAAIDAVIADAAQRGISCRFTGLTHDDCALLEQLFPGKFRYHFDRDAFDYVYDIDDLADLKGRKFQRKRNHLNRFRTDHPDCRLVPISAETLPLAQKLVADWYALRLQENPHADYQLEQAALKKALAQWDVLELEGMLLMCGEEVFAMTAGSRLSADTFDIHFEKALDIHDGAYAAINQGFAAHLREKYPQVRYLNREDDLGLEGLRKAKLSYCPDHMIEKNWACLLEDGYDY